MNTRRHSFLPSLGFCLLCAVMAFYLAPAAHVQNSAKAETQTKGGLQVTTFDTPQGRITLNLPGDIMAGDTISGTVAEEPKGQTKEERARNLTSLDGYVIDFRANQSFKRLTLRTAYAVAKRLDNVSEIFSFTVPKDTAPQTSRGVINQRPQVILKDKDGNSMGTAPLVIFPVMPLPKEGDNLAPLTFHLPTTGQAGRPIEIIGPFDGDSSNTKLGWTPVRSSTQDVAKPTENPAREIRLIAESPRKAVFTAPTNVSGPIELHLTEGQTQTSGGFRNLRIDLSAPKTNLLKGESTELHVEVSGLEGIKEPVPLHLTKGGVVTMQGGDAQTMSIKPSEVQSNGTFTTTRTITGVQAGAWNAIATVVVFDVCLQDDSNGNSIRLNRETGDYIFCPGRSALVGANPIALDTMNFDFSGGVRLAVGDLDASGKLNPFTLEHNAPDRRVLINLDWASFPTAGSAVVQIPETQQKFTITDRNLRDNTCACK